MIWEMVCVSSVRPTVKQSTEILISVSTHSLLDSILDEFEVVWRGKFLHALKTTLDVLQDVTFCPDMT